MLYVALFIDKLKLEYFFVLSCWAHFFFAAFEFCKLETFQT